MRGLPAWIDRSVLIRIAEGDRGDPDVAGFRGGREPAVHHECDGVVAGEGDIYRVPPGEVAPSLKVQNREMGVPVPVSSSAKAFFMENTTPGRREPARFL